MVFHFLIMLITGLAAVAPLAQSDTCSCTSSVADQIDSADSVFVGVPVEVVQQVEGPAGVEQLWSFEVTEVHLGPEAETISVSGGGALSNCSVDFVAGEEQGVVAVWSSGHLTTSLCGVVPTASLASAAAATSPSTRMVVASLGALAVAGFGVTIQRWRAAGQ